MGLSSYLLNCLSDPILLDCLLLDFCWRTVTLLSLSAGFFDWEHCLTCLNRFAPLPVVGKLIVEY